MSPLRFAGILLVFAGVAAGGAGGAFYLIRSDTVARPAAAIVVIPRTVRTVSWYEAHQPEMMKKLSACKDNPGAGKLDPECQNALDAKEHVDIQNFLASAPK